MKKFVLRTLLFSIPLLLLVANFIFLSCKKEQTGDLAKIGHVFFDNNYHERLTNILDSSFVSDVDFAELPDSSIILCFGDSFSNRRPYRFQNAVGQQLNSKVYNVLYNLDYCPEDAALSFLTFAPQEKMPQIIIVESVERYMIPRLYWLNFNDTPSLECFYTGKKHSTSAPKKNYDEEFFNYYQRLTNSEPQIIVSQLDKHCFSLTDNSQKLYSFFEDTIHYTLEQQQGSIENIGRLHKLAKARNVSLFYLAIPNKSTVYAKHVVGRHQFFTPLDNPDLFDTMPYVFTPLEMLRQQVEEDSLDIYFADDTHWTPKTARKVGIKLSEIISSNK